jgi:hypothetical protein
MRQISREQAALHEAGHAVISLVLRTGVSRVQVIEGPESWAGLTSYRRSDLRHNSPRDVVERRALTTVGGIAAERVAAGRPDDSEHEPPDVFAALEFVCRLGGITDLDESKDEINAGFSALVDRASDILEARWPQVEAIVSALVATPDLNRRRLIKIATARTPPS